MGKGISQLATKTYTSLVKKVFPVGDHNALQGEPNNNPVLQHALFIIAGEAYHKFGLPLVPLSVMFNIIQHVDITRPVWVKQELNLIENIKTLLNSVQQMLNSAQQYVEHVEAFQNDSLT